MSLRPLYRWARAKFLHDLMPVNRSRHLPAGANSVELVGYFSLVAGVGEAARLCAETLAAGGRWDVRCIDAGGSVSKARENAWVPPAPGPRSAGPAEVRMLHLNPPMMPPAIVSLGRANYRRAFNIGCWAWELEVLPAEWVKALRYVNAVFVPSTFTKTTIDAYTDKPVLVVPHPIRLGPAEPGLRARLGVPQDAFLVSTIFSYGSSFGRKNPVGALRAFQDAFRDDPNAYFVVKTSHGKGYENEVAAMRALVENPERVLLVDDIWPGERISALIGASDAYISLHRSEGFGLTIAEAILRDVPVVTTAWSGNMDFCHPQACHLVEARTIPVDDSYPEFLTLKQARWADPDVGHAATGLREIAADRAAAARRSQVAREFLRDYLAANSYERALDQLRA